MHINLLIYVCFHIIRCKGTTKFLNTQDFCKKVYKNLHICNICCNFVLRFSKLSLCLLSALRAVPARVKQR